MRRLVANLSAMTLVAAGAFATAGPAAAQGHRSDHEGHSTTVWVHGNGAKVKLSRTSVDEGRISFTVDTSNKGDNGSQITLFRLVGHATLNTFKKDLAKEFSQEAPTAAKGTRGLIKHARFFGLADVVKGTPAKVTEQLGSGRYYLMDLGNGPGATGPAFTTFTVRDSDRDGDDRGSGHSDNQRGRSHGPVVKMTSADTFVSPRTLPARGTVTVRNVSDTLHFMSIARVKDGTTDALIKKFFATDKGSQGPPPFLADGPSVGLDVLSPGRQAELTYHLPRGTYVLVCFIADEVDGVPHAIMGMHKVVTLK